MIIHVVQPGESIYSISRIYRVNPLKVIADNELTNPNYLVVGQTIVILEGVRLYKVVAGDSIYFIGRRFGVSIQEIINANPSLKSGRPLYSGEFITIPNKTIKLGTIEVSGYTFPTIDMNVLRKTLPNLTYLSIFSYDVLPDGSLKTINDTPLIEAARAAKVAPMMVITNIKVDGGFSSDIAHSILTNQQAQNNLLTQVEATLKAKKYYGLNVDFEYIYQYDRESYNSFIKKVTARLNSLGYIVSTSLAPKNAATQKGLLYEAHDYPVHGAVVARVVLMTYEWGYTAGPPLPVAPINEVRKVLNYAVTVIPRNKILMGCPNYGYNWILPYKPGTLAKTISNVGAVNLAINVGADIQYDYMAEAPFFTYYDANGIKHIVWFEDARTVRAEMLLVNEYKLQGVSYWTIGKYFPQNWLVLNSYYNVKKLI